MDKSALRSFKGSHGGELRNTRWGRQGSRPLSTRATMHLMLRSSKAKGAWSFHKKSNRSKIRKIIRKFSARHQVKVISVSCIACHLHLEVKLGRSSSYNRFIRAITSSLAMALCGSSRWRSVKKNPEDRFWDYRPFSWIIQKKLAPLYAAQFKKLMKFEAKVRKGLKTTHIFRINALLLDST